MDRQSQVAGEGSTVTDGNEAWAWYSVVVGGQENVAGDDSSTDRSVGEASAVLAGELNRAEGDLSAICGGQSNTTSGNISSVTAGNLNTASGFLSSVTGGESNEASGGRSTVSGGYNRSVTAKWDWKAGTLFEDD